MIRIFNAQPVKIPHFKSLLTRKQARWPHLFIAFFNVHIMNVNYAKFQKKFDRTISTELPLLKNFSSQKVFLERSCLYLTHQFLQHQLPGVVEKNIL